MSFTFELKWLLLLPLGAIVVFASWVFWNLSREIASRKRRWVITYRETDARIGGAESRSAIRDSPRSDYTRKAS